MADPRRDIHFEQRGLAGVLKAYQLEVPTNQRDYAWGELEVQQLFQDFAKAVNDDVDYFLGTVVTIPKGENQLELVDGQQRLATTAILLSAIRNYCQEIKENILVDSINSEFLVGFNRRRREPVAKLNLNVDDNALFGKIVRHEDITKDDLTRPSQQRLANAFGMAVKQVRNIVAGLDVRDHGDQLDRWISFAEHRGLVVLLRVPRGADAFKMFETLNDRGLKTSQADLIKNFLFGQSGSRLTEVQARWSRMKGTLESMSDEDLTVDFLRHALIVTSGFVREADVYDKVQAEVRSELTAVALLSRLESLATDYVAISNPEHERWNGYDDSVRRALEVLNLFNIRPIRPTLLTIANKFSPNEAKTAVNFLISLGVRLIIAASTRTGSVELPLATTAFEIYRDQITTTSELKNALVGQVFWSAP